MRSMFIVRGDECNSQLWCRNKIKVKSRKQIYIMSLYSVFAIFVIEKDVQNYPRVFAYDDANHIVLGLVRRNQSHHPAFCLYLSVTEIKKLVSLAKLSLVVILLPTVLLPIYQYNLMFRKLHAALNLRSPVHSLVMVNLNMDGIICNMATVEASQHMLRSVADLGLSEGGLWTPRRAGGGLGALPRKILIKLNLKRFFKAVYKGYFTICI